MTTDTFGKYVIEGVLGRGGMAEALKCRLSGPGGFDKVVVVKRILPNLVTEPEFVEMFRAEARVAANLSHPNVVQVFETDEIDGIPYIAMEYVNGLTLQRLARASSNAPRIGAMARIIADVAEGLHYVHHARDQQGTPLGLVHRDVSPANIIISTDGVPKLLDFGVAKAEDTHTRAGVLKGKPRYMSPEQIQGVPLDARSDVFSLGVCLYEATTFRSPFTRGQPNEAATMRAILEGIFARPSELVPGYPSELEQIVLWTMSTNLDERCPTAAALRDRLELFCSTGAFAVQRREVGGWVQALISDPSVHHPPTLSAPSYESSRLRNRPGAPYPATPPPTSGIRPPPQPSTPSAVEAHPAETSNVVTTTRLRMRVLTGLGTAGVLAIGALLLVLFSSRSSPQPTVEAPRSQRRPSVEPAVEPAPAVQEEKGNKAAAAYLLEAERYLTAQKFAPALELVNKARALNAPDPALNIRITALNDSIERETTLARGQTLLRDGDVAAAIEAAKAVLARDPGSEDGANLLSAARAQQAKQTAAHAPPAAHTKTAPKVVMAKVAVTSTPSAMVFVDGEPVGRSPVEYEVTPGRHTVQVRLRGYTPVETEVQAIGGRAASVALSLIEEHKADENAKPKVDVVDSNAAVKKPNVLIVDENRAKPAVLILDDEGSKPRPEVQILDEPKPKVQVVKE